MNEQELDVRGLPCPQPVLRTRKAMEDTNRLKVLVSDLNQAENVSRMALRNGWKTSVMSGDGDYAVFLVRSVPVGAESVKPRIDAKVTIPVLPERDCVVVFSSDEMGSGAAPLGKILMKAFVNTLRNMESRPAAIIFYNSGVKLAVAGSPVLEDLASLAAGGLDMLVCGTCLEYYGLKEQVKVGSVSNMFEIASRLVSGGRVVRI
ncbi:sulfurtransferase-like selenium metabolism protein YedF [bacterium]|nr:sulfurtransferase-like selenium metabolism protein YedF [candidate division CSSED10-310 bacterium]